MQYKLAMAGTVALLGGLTFGFMTVAETHADPSTCRSNRIGYEVFTECTDSRGVILTTSQCDVRDSYCTTSLP